MQRAAGLSSSFVRMEPFYLITFLVLAACTAVLEVGKASGAPKAYSSDQGFLAFRNNYILVYSLMMGARTTIRLAPAGSKMWMLALCLHNKACSCACAPCASNAATLRAHGLRTSRKQWPGFSLPLHLVHRSPSVLGPQSSPTAQAALVVPATPVLLPAPHRVNAMQ